MSGSVEVSTRDVVVGVDGSEGGYHAMAWAAGEAARLATRLVVLHAYALPVGVGAVAAPAGRPDPRAEAEALLARARARLDRTARTGALAAEPAEVAYATVRGDASAALVHHARRGAVVVVGRRGVGTFDRVLMGSVSSSVAALAPGTVVVVPRAARVQDPRRVVAAVDPSEPLDRVLEAGFDEADRAGVALLAAHAVDRGMFVGVTEGDLDWLERLRAEARADLEARASLWGEKYPRVRWTVEGRGGHAPGALLAVLRSDDLVVTGGRDVREVVRGSVPDRLVRHAPCPVSVVHP
ncbi:MULTISPECIES: universal stress protein [unclassified Isoptericola]|uniref:universal stress protein n=1 Tax=unclassified Isoptericola TaxID=2623355 RepID=UPI003652E960